MPVIGRRVDLLRRRGRTIAQWWRPLTGGAASVCLALVIAACGGGPSTPASTTASTTAPAVVPTVSATPAPAPSFVGTPAERLARALTGLGVGYTFETTLRVGEQVAAHVSGRRFGNASELVIESGGASATYRIVPPTAWIQQGGGDWVEAAGTVPSGDPLAPLLAPLTVDALPTTTGDDQLRATYPAAALGLSGTDPVTVTIGIAADGTVTARYEAPVGGVLGTSETTLTSKAAQDPILAPSPLPSAAG